MKKPEPENMKMIQAETDSGFKEIMNSLSTIVSCMKEIHDDEILRQVEILDAYKVASDAILRVEKKLNAMKLILNKKGELVQAVTATGLSKVKASLN